MTSAIPVQRTMQYNEFLSILEHLVKLKFLVPSLVSTVISTIEWVPKGVKVTNH